MTTHRTATPADVRDYLQYIAELAGTEAVRQIIDQYPRRLFDHHGYFIGTAYEAYLLIDHCRWVYPLEPLTLYDTRYEQEFNRFARQWAPHPDCTAPSLVLYPHALHLYPEL